MQKAPSKAQGMALLIFVNVLWGLSFIFSKTVIAEGMPPMTAAFLRYALTALIMLPVCLRREKSIRLRKWAPRAFASTMLGVTVYFYFEYTGLRYTTASAASLILALVPMMTLLWRVICMRERISPLRWGCVLISLIGAYWVIAADADDGKGMLLGNLLMIAACLCWTGYIIITPKLVAACSNLRVSTWQAVFGALTLAPFALAQRSQWVALSPVAWLCLFLLAAVCSALCYVLYNLAMRAVDSISVSLTININPIAACIGGALLLGETLTPMQLCGGVLIMLSVLADSLETSGAFKKQG